MKCVKLAGFFVLTLGFLTHAHAQDPFANGLVAYYPLNGDGKDAAGQNPLVLSNVLFGADRLGIPNGCMLFDGDNRWCQSQNPVDSSIVDNFTMTIWAKLGGFLSDSPPFYTPTNGDVLVMASQGAASYGDGHAGVGILAGTNGVAIWEHSSGYINYPVIIRANLTEWTQIGIVYNNPVISLYINGHLAGIGSANPSFHFHPSSGETISSWGIPFYGGLGLYSWYNGTTETWNQSSYKGSIDEFRIFSRPLSVSEMQQLYSYEAEPRIALMKAMKAVMPSFSNLCLGTNYQLQVSGDLNTWTNQGSAFTATNSSMVYPDHWDVDNWSKLFFRLRTAP